eukprot:722872-Alexandrium_andersonii.AAC.1
MRRTPSRQELAPLCCRPCGAGWEDEAKFDYDGVAKHASDTETLDTADGYAASDEGSDAEPAKRDSSGRKRM